MKKIFWSLAVVTLLFSCNDSGSDVDLEVKKGEKRSKLAAGSQSEDELRAAAEKRREEQAKKEEENKANQTTMEVTPNVHDFGEIEKESPVSTIFTVKNTGDKPLTINDAKASCGCTVPRKPEKPILPGETGELEVTFTSKPNQAGQEITKTVTITANIPNSTKVVTIKGKVKD
ncbi:MAG: DUF1573 domain-containing protein [Brumimicrobium sp.]